MPATDPIEVEVKPRLYAVMNALSAAAAAEEPVTPDTADDLAWMLNDAFMWLSDPEAMASATALR